MAIKENKEDEITTPLIDVKEQPTEKPKWHAFLKEPVGIIGGLLGIIIAILTIYLTVKEKILPVKIPQNYETLKGIVLDKNQKGLSKAQVSINLIPGKIYYTTTDGTFKIDSIPAKVGESTRVRIQHPEFIESKDQFWVIGKPLTVQLKN